MQQVQQRELPEQMSWARAMIFAVGFFFIAAILIGQLPGYINLQMTAATLDGFERGMLGLGLTCLGGFAIIMVIVMLFDPKPIVPPRVFTVLGAILAIGGLVLSIWSTTTGCVPTNNPAALPVCNQYFPMADTSWNPLLGGKFLWFQAGSVDFLMVGLVLLGVGLAMIFYSVLALREMRNPDRRDLGTTPAIRRMIIAGSLLLVLFLVFYTYYDNQGLASALFPSRPYLGLKVVDLGISIVLGAAIVLTFAAFALRLHYLMRPVRKRVMPGLYAFGALGLAQFGAALIIAWFVAYPLIAWMHTWTLIGLNDYLTICTNPSNVPGSCSFSQQAGYIINAVVTSNFLLVLLGAVWAWRSHRNLVVVGCFVTVAMAAAATLVLHTAPDQIIVALLLCAAMLVLAGVWTSVARREFAVVGENRLGCIGQWLVVGTCLFIYLASFAFFSLPVWAPETEPNIPFIPGLGIPPPTLPGQAPNFGTADAIIMLFVMGILAAIQFYFLTRNRYRV